MLRKDNIVYFGPEKWEGMWRNRQQLMSRFARCNKVMYVEPVVGLKRLMHHLRQGRFKQVDFWKSVGQRRVRRISDNLYIYNNPAFIPVSGRFPLDKITWRVWKWLLRRTMQKLGFHRPIIWLSKPGMIKLIRSFGEKLTVYHVVDEYAAYGDLDSERKEKLRVLEQKMLKSADLVIVVSDKLYQNKSAYNKHTYKVSNGVDYESYERALSSDQPQPADIAQVSRPIVGYSGLISGRLDLGLIEYVAIKHPEWSLVLIGAVDDRGCKSGIARLRQLKNIYFLGVKRIRQVPHYIKVFDVCLLPYLINEETENLSALKLYDYMAAGKPTVSMDVPAAKEFARLIHIAASKETFTRFIEEALFETDNGLYNARRRIASLNTWDHRVKEISRLIETISVDE